MSRWCCVFVVCLLAQAFCVPVGDRINAQAHRLRRAPQDSSEKTSDVTSSTTTTTSKYDFDDDDDDDFDFDEQMDTAPSTGGGGGSDIISLLNLATALFPSSSSANKFIRNMIRQYLIGRPQPFFPNLPLLRRQDIKDNTIEVDYVKKLTPPFQKQEIEEEEDDDDDEDEHDDSESESEENNAAEESDAEKENDAAEESVENNGRENSKQDSNGNGDDDNDSDYSDEPPGGGDGQGGGILGLLAGLSGGDGQSDLGSLLAVVSEIVVNLSGDGFDLNSLIASGLGLFVGLLSEGEENPGAVIAKYLLTSLETITGGGANNNGAFFGNFISKLVKGTSAAGNDEENSAPSSEENGMTMSDSTGFFVSLLMSLLGDMSKGSSSGSSHPWVNRQGHQPQPPHPRLFGR